ncbi:DUF397 domain-containing protein [Streptomyces paromomycinus]|uniref:Toxin n=1 Tax=Streptomyces paromomycinus TaxID=92743 RepID=A0A401VXG5_STREY|nr:DUF397 domain-containing protein [Streptomyces paromomycinus]GCD41774.1 toxin [Streptomyces paromomycinus]
MNHQLDQFNWFKSSYSGQPSTDCVEAAFTDQAVAVRDSKDPDGPFRLFPQDAWVSFIGGVKAGAFGSR